MGNPSRAAVGPSPLWIRTSFGHFAQASLFCLRSRFLPRCCPVVLRRSRESDDSYAEFAIRMSSTRALSSAPAMISMQLRDIFAVYEADASE